MNLYEQSTTTKKQSTEQPTALCISEDKAFLNNLRVNLGKSGFIAITTSNAAEATALAENSVVDAIICDYDLTQTDGISLFESIQAYRGTGTMPPTLIIAEQFSTPLLSRAVTAGAAGIHTKSEPIDSLVARTISLLRNSQMRGQVEELFPKRALHGATDPLTRVATRQQFSKRFAAESAASLRDQNCLSIVLLAIDRYSSILDQYGLKIMESVLANAARVVEGELRSRDSVGRYADHIFCIALPDTDHGAARAVADRLRRLLKATEFGNLDCPVNISISAGLASRPRGNRTAPEEMLEQAGRNLAAAETLGGDRVIADGRLSGRPVTLILSGDNLAARTLNKDFEVAGLEVRVSYRIEEAKKILETVPVSMITVIEPLPEEEAIEFLKWTRDKYPRTRRLLLSAKISTDMMSRAINGAAINYFLPLPWSADELKSVADQVINS